MPGQVFPYVFVDATYSKARSTGGSSPGQCGLTGVQLVIADAHLGLRQAVDAVDSGLGGDMGDRVKAPEGTDADRGKL